MKIFNIFIGMILKSITKDIIELNNINIKSLNAHIYELNNYPDLARVARNLTGDLATIYARINNKINMQVNIDGFIKGTPGSAIDRSINESIGEFQSHISIMLESNKIKPVDYYLITSIFEKMKTCHKEYKTLLSKYIILPNEAIKPKTATPPIVFGPHYDPDSRMYFFRSPPGNTPIENPLMKMPIKIDDNSVVFGRKK